MQLSFCLPSIEATSGHELCFISHPNYDRRLSCNIFGHIWMDGKWKGWEVWRFIKDDSGDFIITSWTHNQKVLCSDGDGRVYTTENKEGSWEKWKISLHPNHGVRIQSVEHGRSLAFSGQDLYTMDKDEDTSWHLEPAHRNQFFLTSATTDDTRLSCTKEHKLVSHKNRKLWEKWIVEPTNSTAGNFTIRSLEHKKYLSSSDDGKLVVSESPAEHGHRLSLNDNNDPCTVKASGGWKTWILEPTMPNTISGKQICSYVGIGATTIGLSVAMPFAAMGIIGGMGFGASGIVAGSTAAGMMSAEAIAMGGGVAVGGTVASLQSIGAVGLGTSLTAAAATSGALVGGVTSFGVAKASNGLDNGLEGIKLDVPNINLPLCAWRMWS